MKEKILVVDDEPFIRDILKTVLQEHYDIDEAADGEDALEKLKKHQFSLVILDYKMPKKDGLEVCRQIRKDSLYLHTPVIMLTGKGETQDKIAGLEAGVDDYIIKPFEPEELLARVKMVLRRSARDLDASPLTRLPGNVSIYNEINQRLERKESFAVLYLDLNKFKAYNDYYGFKEGDFLIQKTARLIIEVVNNRGSQNDFIGHIGGDDFVIITEVETARAVASYIVEEFDRIAPSFYKEADRKKGFIITKDRQGRERRFSILSVAIGIVWVRPGIFSHVGEISGRGAEVKAYAKSFQKSIYVEDKRM